MTVVTNIEYLDRLELYQTEKPYVTTFEIPESVGKSTNHCYVSHEAEIQNAKQIKGDFSLDVHGFEFHDWPTKLQSADFENLDLITSSYYSEILQQMERAFPRAFNIQILTHLRRKRVESFNNSLVSDPGNIKHPNIVSYAHTDFSPYGAQVAVQRLLAQNEYLRGRRFEIINAWRVTKGPNRNWPLALCDYTSLDLGDVELSDVIHKEKVGESTRLYYNPNQRWYFIDHQTTSEVALFRNVDSRGFHVPFAMHLAFPNPGSNGKAGSEGTLRESIETRFALFY